MTKQERQDTYKANYVKEKVRYGHKPNGLPYAWHQGIYTLPNKYWNFVVMVGIVKMIWRAKETISDTKTMLPTLNQDGDKYDRCVDFINRTEKQLQKLINSARISMPDNAKFPYFPNYYKFRDISY